MIQCTLNHDASMIQCTTNHDASMIQCTPNHDASMIQCTPNHDASMIQCTNYDEGNSNDGIIKIDTISLCVSMLPFYPYLVDLIL